MIDTLRLQWTGINWGQDMADWLRSEYPTAEQHVRWYDDNLPWEGMTAQDDALGSFGVKSNKRGNYLWVERSLPKFLHGDNCRVLSADETGEAVRGLMAGVEGRFGPWWLPGMQPRQGVQVKRVDLCYQRQVPCSGEVFGHVARSLKQRKVALHLSGVELHQSKLEHARWYDKGIESGNERYLDVVRHEEQLRGGKAGWLLDVSQDQPALNVAGAAEVMNKRYEGWDQVEGYDLGALMEEHGTSGAAAALLVLHPEYDRLCGRYLSKSVYYRLRNLALEGRRRQCSLDLRVPQDAWAVSMVL
jgi:hypothetical protein